MTPVIGDYEQSSGLHDPASYAFAITPGTKLPQHTRGLLVGVAGNVSLRMVRDSAFVTVALAAGVVHPLRVAEIQASGTTATDIVGLA